VQAPPGSRATLGVATGAAAGFTPDVPGTYQLSLTTTDGTGSSATSSVAISVSCGVAPPVVSSLSGSQTGPGGSVTTPNPLAVGVPVSLAASVTDPDATILGACQVAEAQPLSYQWSFAQVPPGSAATLLAASTATPSFVPDVPGTYQVQLVVADPQGHTGTAAPFAIDAHCGASAPSVRPVAGAVPEFSLTQAVSVNGGSTNEVIVHSSDPTKTLASGVSSVVRPLYPGAITQLSVPVLGSSAFPITQAGCPAFVDPGITYRWSIVAQPPGSRAAFIDPSAASPSFTPDLPGTYDFQLVLTDQAGRSTTTILSVDAFGAHPGAVGTCGTNPPIVVEAVPVSGPTGTRVALDASGTQSPDDYRAVLGGVVQSYPAGCGLAVSLSYQWSLIQVPPRSTAVLSSATMIDPSFVPDLPGAYTVQLTVGDGRSATTRTAMFTAMFTAGATSPGPASGPVFTATATDTAGLPVMAWWDPAARTVTVARCTAGCTGPSPTWTTLGGAPLDTNLGPIAYSPDDEPRPVALRVGAVGGPAAGNVFVAYYTGAGAAAATTGAGQTFCTFTLAQWTGTGWNRVQPQPHGIACDAAITTGIAFGQYLSLDIDPGGGPVVGWTNNWSPPSGNATQPYFTLCSSGCTGNWGTTAPAFATRLIRAAASGERYGKFLSLRTRGSGLDAVYYADNVAGAAGLQVAECPTCFTGGGFNLPFAVAGAAGVNVGRFAQVATVPPTASNGLANPLLVAAYADTSSAANVVKLVTCDTGASACTAAADWSAPVTVADPATTSYGRALSLAVDASGLPRLAYLDLAASKVRLLSGQLQAPISFKPLGDLGANASPVGLSLAFSSALGATFLGWSGPGGPLVFSAP
jgi:hypothetical protein